MKAFKLIIALLLGLLVLIGLALAALTTLINPNDYKDEIRNAALEQAGIELQIDGDIGWSIYPWLALELNAVGVGYPQKPQLGRLQRAEVSVAIPALLSGELQMNRLLIDGLTLDLVQAADGSNNWTSNTLPSAGKDKPTSEQPAPDNGKQPLAIDIEAIEVRNAGLTYTDQRNNSRIELSSLNLTSGQISSGNSFPLELRFALKQFAADQLQLSSTADLSTQVNLDLSSNHYQLNDLTAALELTEGAGLPAALQLTLATSLDARLNEQQIDLRNLNIQADPLTIQGELSLRNFGQPELSGQLSSNRFDLKQLLKTLGQNAPTTADAKALGALSFNTTLSGPAGTVQLKPLQLQLDDTRFDGEASLVLATQAVAIILKGNALDADRYLPPKQEPASPAAATSDTAEGKHNATHSWPKEELIPLAPLRALNLSADVDLTSLKINDIQLGQPSLSLVADKGLIRLNRFNTHVFDGQVSASARLDARQTPLKLSLSPQIQNLAIGQLLSNLANTDALAGKFNANAELSLRGQSIHAWVNSLSGKANLSMAEGVLKGIDAAQSLCQGINNLSALWIDAEQVDKATPFADLSASFNLINGVVSNSDLSAQLDAMHVAGRGKINLPQQNLDYRIGLTLQDNLFNQSCSVNNRLEGVEIPVNCTGGFRDEPARLCRLDTSFISNAIKAEAKRRVEEKVSEKLEDKLKEKLGEEGAGKVLQGLFGK